MSTTRITLTKAAHHWKCRLMMHWNDQFLIPAVPIVAVDMELPETSDKLLEMATGKSLIDNGPREGLVFRSLDGKRSFKAVSNSFLVKYHG